MKRQFFSRIFFAGLPDVVLDAGRLSSQSRFRPPKTAPRVAWQPWRGCA